MSRFLVKVRFLEDRRVKDAEGRLFEKDCEYEMAPDSARHWVRRGVAVIVPRSAEPPAPPPPEPSSDPVNIGESFEIKPAFEEVEAVATVEAKPVEQLEAGPEPEVQLEAAPSKSSSSRRRTTKKV